MTLRPVGAFWLVLPGPVPVDDLPDRPVLAPVTPVYYLGGMGTATLDLVAHRRRLVPHRLPARVIQPDVP